MTKICIFCEVLSKLLENKLEPYIWSYSIVRYIHLSAKSRNRMRLAK